MQSAPPRIFGDQIWVFPGPMQFKHRTPGAILHIPMSMGRNTSPVTLVSDQRELGVPNSNPRGP
eukprot:8870615-Alexandrium_andersonii.AAC.1